MISLTEANLKIHIGPGLTQEEQAALFSGVGPGRSIDDVVAEALREKAAQLRAEQTRASAEQAAAA